MPFRTCLFAFVCIAASVGATAQKPAWPPPSNLTTMNLWPNGAVPDPVPTKGPEGDTGTEKNAIASRPVIIWANVSMPTMTLYPAKGTPNGAAVVVFPGGGYNIQIGRASCRERV